MKKLIEIAPFIAVAVIIAILLGIVAANGFGKPAKKEISSTTLVEVLPADKLATARYMQNGVAKAYIEGKGTVYIMYYATVAPVVNVSDIQFDIDHRKETVTVILPENFDFDVTPWVDDTHTYHYYPRDAKDYTGKEILTICEQHAKEAAAQNQELIDSARTNLIKTISILLDPVMDNSGYRLIVQ